MTVGLPPERSVGIGEGLEAGAGTDLAVGVAGASSGSAGIFRGRVREGESEERSGFVTGVGSARAGEGDPNKTSIKIM